MDRNGGACKKMQANIHGRNHYILPVQSHYGGYRSQDTGKLPVSHRAEKIRTVLKTAHHRPAQASQNDLQHTDNIEIN